MTISDFDGSRFWPAIKQFVIDMGVEPISLGEPEDEVWPKIFAAMAVNGTPLSFGMSEAEIKRTLNAALAQGGGVAPPSSFAPYPAPSGLKWVFVYEATEGGEQVYEAANDPEIELVAA